MATAHYPYLPSTDPSPRTRKPVTLFLTGQGRPQRITLYPYNFDSATICVVSASGATLLKATASAIVAKGHTQLTVPCPGLYFVESSDGFYHEIKECRIEN